MYSHQKYTNPKFLSYARKQKSSKQDLCPEYMENNMRKEKKQTDRSNNLR